MRQLQIIYYDLSNRESKVFLYLHLYIQNLLKEIQSYSTIDVYAFDQILPYMVIAKSNGPSICMVRELSNHASTNMWLLKQFFEVDFEAAQTEDNIKITVR